MKDVVIVGGVRTAVGAFGGALKNTPVVDLGALVIHDALKRLNLKPVAGPEVPEFAPDALAESSPIELEQRYQNWSATAQAVTVDEVVMGHVLQAGQGQNTARQAMIAAGIPKETPAFTINKVCGSGLKAIALGAASIATGQAEVIIAGGMENMSQVPMALPKAPNRKYSA